MHRDLCNLAQVLHTLFLACTFPFVNTVLIYVLSLVADTVGRRPAAFLLCPVNLLALFLLPSGFQVVASSGSCHCAKRC